MKLYGLIAALLGTVFLVSTAVLFLRYLLRKRQELERHAMSRYGHEGILLMEGSANFLGTSSRKMGQIRGNGLLVVTRKNLIFNRLLPDMELRIPLSRIISVENPRSFLGKRVFRPLVKVTYLGSDGSRDSSAWHVKDPSAFSSSLLDAVECFGKDSPS
jgi:hypothetical protein